MTTSFTSIPCERNHYHWLLPVADALPKKENRKKKNLNVRRFPATKKERKTCSGQSTLSHCMMSVMKAVSWFWHEYQLKVAALVLLSSMKTTKYFLFNKIARSDLKAAFQFLEPSDGDNTDEKQTKKKACLLS